MRSQRGHPSMAAVLRALAVVVGLLGLTVASLAVARQLDLPDSAEGARQELRPGAPLAAPDALAAQGSLVRSAVLPDGRVAVTHWIRSNRPVRSINLSAPPGPRPDSGPRATELDIRTISGKLLISDRQVGSASRTIDLVRDSTLIRMRYTLEDVTETAESQPTRALVRGVGLDAVAVAGADDQGGSKQVHVLAPGLLSLACSAPGAEPGDARPCGRPRATGGWVVTLAGSDLDDRVTAQVDLPPTSGES